MARFIMAGRLQAAAFIGLTTLLSLLLPLFSLFANAGVGLVTLRSGFKPGLAMVAIASFVITFVSIAMGSSPIAGFFIGVVQFFPVIVVSWVLTKTVSWKKALFACVGTGVISLFIFSVIVGDIDQYWMTLLEQYKSILMKNAGSDSWEVFSQKIIPWLTNFVAFIYVLFLSVSLMLARSWQAQLFNPSEFGKEFRQIRLGKKAVIVFAFLVVLAFLFKQSIVSAIMMMVMALFFIQGLSLIHGLVHQTGMHVGWLVGMYIFLIFMHVHIIMMLVTMGIVDNFADIRKRLLSRR